MLKQLPSGSKPCQATTAETIRFSEADTFSGEAVRRYVCSMTGAGRDVDSLNSITVKAGTRPIWQLNERMHAAVLARLSKKEGPLGADVAFTIPMDLLGAFGPSVGMPRNMAAAIEIDIDVTPAAVGLVNLSTQLTQPLVPTQFYPMCLESATNVPASATNRRVPIDQPGYLAGIGLSSTTNITSVQLYVANELVFDGTVQDFFQSQAPEQGGVVTLNEFILIPDLPAIVPGATFLQLTVGAGYAATDTYAVLSLVPQPASK